MNQTRPETPGRPAVWADAGLVAALVAVDPVGIGGVVLRARPGSAREAWLAGMRALVVGLPWRRVPPGIDDSRLLGGIDLAATLSAGRPVAEQGVLAGCDGGLLVLAMAERAGPGLCARLGAALDRGEVVAERDGLTQRAPARFGVIALDEGAEPEERVSPALADRLALALDLSGVTHAEATPFAFGPADIAAARGRRVALDPQVITALTATAAALGIDSLRAVLQALCVARAAAALLGLAEAGTEAAEIAARLVLAPRATRAPAPPEEAPEEAPEPPEPDDTPDQTPDPGEGALAERVLEAAVAALPPGLLAGMLAAPPRGGGGKAGAERKSAERGRPVGVDRGLPRGGRRLDLIATLRSAAPWQRLRQAAGRIEVRADDFRLKRFKRRSETATIMVVDASGSAAVARLAEAKGAVELLLAESYVRRDQVALIAFRGQGAEVLLPPTRAPALAKKRLSGLPGGGGTPLAAGIEAATQLAVQLRGRGVAALVVFLTDGRANIGRDGAPGRPGAMADALQAGRALRAAGIAALMIDTGARPGPAAAEAAGAMGARYVPMPFVNAAAVSRAARAARAT